MKVQDVNGLVRSIDPRTTKRPEQQPIPTSPKDVRNSDGDSLDIQLSSRISDISNSVEEAAVTTEITLSRDRLRQIEQRIHSGFYDTPVVSEDTANKLLEFYAQ